MGNSKDANKGGRNINVTMKVTDEVNRELADISEREKRSLSQVGYLLVLRGLERYRRDGELVQSKPVERPARPRSIAS